LDKFVDKRIRNAEYLTKKLGKIEEITTPYVSKVKHVFHQYTIKVENRNWVNESLNKVGIGTGIYYPLPLNDQPFYKKLGYTSKETPIAKKCSEMVLSLPVHPSLTKENLDYICKNLEEIVK